MPALPFGTNEVNEMVRAQFPGTANSCVELGRDHAVASYDVRSNDIRPGGFISGTAQGETLYCRATLEAVSRRSVVGTAHVWCDDRPNKITATAQGTYAIPLPR